MIQVLELAEKNFKAALKKYAQTFKGKDKQNISRENLISEIKIYIEWFYRS